MKANSGFDGKNMPARVALNQPLPPDVVTGVIWGPFCYRRYPVFSLRWLALRTLVTCTAVLIYGVLSLLAWGSLLGRWGDAWAIVGYFATGFCIMLFVGPALATWARYQRWSLRWEGVAVVAAAIIGISVAACADDWASSRMMPLMKLTPAPKVRARTGPDLSKAQLTLAGLAGLGIYVVSGGGLAAVAYFSERRRIAARQALMAQLDTDMRLAVLQAQIEPHFLFNTLASIRPLIRKDAVQAETALDALADHLRATIPLLREQSRSVVSTLGQQLDICASYLVLMQVRMGSRLHHEVLASPELRGCEFPPMLLLSLVENAIKHGIEPRPGPGRVVLQAAVGEHELRVSVTDDGQGLQSGLSGGLGLANIREQLQVRYGSKARLTVAARAEGGTVAQIAIPLNTPVA